jgi:aspartate aminotransferase-like enzyme
MAQPMFHHRTPQFSALFAEVRAQLQELYQTEQDVLMLAASGTGAMEAAVNGHAEASVTHNVADFEPASSKFGLRILAPAQLMKELLKS